MVMRFDEAGRDIAATGIEHALAAPCGQICADLDDSAMRYAHVGRIGRRAGAIDHGSTLDKNTNFHFPLSRLKQNH